MHSVPCPHRSQISQSLVISHPNLEGAALACYLCCCSTKFTLSQMLETPPKDYRELLGANFNWNRQGAITQFQSTTRHGSATTFCGSVSNSFICYPLGYFACFPLFACLAIIITTPLCSLSSHNPPDPISSCFKGLDPLYISLPASASIRLSLLPTNCKRTSEEQMVIYQSLNITSECCSGFAIVN